MPHDVFVCHSSRDKNVADAVVARLERHGIRCWIAPRDVRPGESWPNAILAAIAGSKAVVLVFSKNANDSSDVHREISLALENGKTVVPLRIEDVVPDGELKYFLSATHWMDAITPPIEQHLDALVGHLARIVEPQAPGAEKTESKPADPPPVRLPRPAPRHSAGADTRTVRLPRAAVWTVVAALVAALALAIWRPWASPDRSGESPGTEHDDNKTPSDSPDPSGPVHLDGFTAKGKNEQGKLEYLHEKSGIVFVYLEGGTFQMGSPFTEQDRSDDETPHSVTLSPFLIAKYEVTQRLWKSVMGAHDFNFSGDDLPAENVTWFDAARFCAKAGIVDELDSSDTGLQGYGLPTEAQWEFACRAGTIGSYAGDFEAFTWYSGNSGNTTHAIDTKLPNAWGIFNTQGNVSEWCRDWFGDIPGERIPSSVPHWALDRVRRGGSWMSPISHCRSASRSRLEPFGGMSDVGFRPARSLR